MGGENTYGREIVNTYGREKIHIGRRKYTSMCTFVQKKCIFIRILASICSPVGTLGGGGGGVYAENKYSVSPYALLKASEKGCFLGITVKRLAPCRCFEEPYEMSLAWEPE